MGCQYDARTVSGPTTLTYSGNTFGWIELRYSPTCQAGWVKFQPINWDRVAKYSVWRPNAPGYDYGWTNKQSYGPMVGRGSQICYGSHMGTMNDWGFITYQGWMFAGCATV
jgi:hypothetical protein